MDPDQLSAVMKLITAKMQSRKLVKQVYSSNRLIIKKMSIKNKMPSLLKPLIEMYYHGWLEIKKRKWKDTLDRRKKQRLNNARSTYHANNELLSVNSYFRRNEDALTRCHWQVMRRNLLKVVDVKEFAPEAEYRTPGPFFTLPNVICGYCNDCRDLDLCRDAALLAGEWRCAVPQCGQPYDREVMENALLQMVRQRERAYHVQDVECLRCRQVKAAHLADQCVCAGSYECKEKLPEFGKKMGVNLEDCHSSEVSASPRVH